jgi:hypothetical protein
MAQIDPTTGKPYGDTYNPFDPTKPIADPKLAEQMQKDYQTIFGDKPPKPARMRPQLSILDGKPITNDTGGGVLQAGETVEERNARLGFGKPNLTVGSGDLVNGTQTTPPTNPYSTALTDALKGLGSFQDNLDKIKNSFTPISADEEARIREGVRAQFAPQFAQQDKTNALRSTLFNAQSAQRKNVGFGSSAGFAEGTGEVSQAGTNALNELSRMQAAEEGARIAAAKSQNRQEQQNYLQLASQLQTQQLQQLSTIANLENQQQQQQQSQAKYVLDSLSELGPEALKQFGVNSFSQLETTLGLPTGFVDQLQATKQLAKNATSQASISDVFNQGATLALNTPAGQSFSLQTPDGQSLQFTGGQKDIQIISNDGGIYSVDKNSGTITTLRAPTPKSSSNSKSIGDGGKLPKLTPFFNQQGQGGFFFQDPNTGAPVFTNQAANQSVEPGKNIRFTTPFGQSSNPLEALGGDFQYFLQQSLNEVINQ